MADEDGFHILIVDENVTNDVEIPQKGSLYKCREHRT